MTDYMNEAKRLAQAYADAVLLGEGNDEALAALLAHIQRGVPDGWKEATIAWEVCASIHREYAKKKDPFFTTRQADFVRHTEAARAAMLAAGMVAEPAEVLMPEPDCFKVTTPDGLTYFRSVPATLPHHTVDPLIAMTQALTYGAAREAAGYARGLKEAGRLISLWLKDPDVQRMLEFARDASRKVTSWPDRLTGEAEAALRGEVRP